MRSWHCVGLLLVTVWGCSTALVDEGARGAAGAGGAPLEPAGGSASNGGSAAAGASGAGQGGDGGTSGDGGTTGDGGTSGDGGTTGEVSAAGGDENCDFGPSAAPETCLGAWEAALEGSAGGTCDSYGSSATLEQLVGAWIYSPSWDLDETLEFANDGSASYDAFTHTSPDFPDLSESIATGTFELFETSIELKVSDWSFKYYTTSPMTMHKAVDEIHHLWYRYDARIR